MQNSHPTTWEQLTLPVRRTSLRVTMSGTEHRVIEDAAKRAGLPPAEWARRVLASAAAAPTPAEGSLAAEAPLRETPQPAEHLENRRTNPSRSGVAAGTRARNSINSAVKSATIAATNAATNAAKNSAIQSPNTENRPAASEPQVLGFLLRQRRHGRPASATSIVERFGCSRQEASAWIRHFVAEGVLENAVAPLDTPLDTPRLGDPVL